MVEAKGGGSGRAGEVLPHVRWWVSDSVLVGVRSWEPASDHCWMREYAVVAGLRRGGAEVVRLLLDKAGPQHVQ